MFKPAVPGHLESADPDLSERQRAVFGALVELHGRTTRAVGSETLASLPGMRGSAASLRLSLAELESIGLLEKAHASGGRVPTALGYAFFVRHLVTPSVLPGDTLAALDRTLCDSAGDVERLFHEASKILSSLTHQLGLALAASFEEERLAGLDLTPLGAQRVLLVLNVGTAHVRTLVLELESPLDPADLEEVGSVLRERLAGRTMREVRRHLESDGELVRRSAVRLVTRAALRGWGAPVSTPLFRAGARHIAEQPEFSYPERIGSVIEAVEDGRPLHRLMVSSIEGRASVRVGLDERQPLADCSLVTYVLPGSIPGAVAVLGPLRMDYAFALAVVDAVGSRVANLLQA
jgi:heat-inducible transcriptional repressor